jgi:hypothetical protein
MAASQPREIESSVENPAGRLAADLATGQTPSVDPAPFRGSRFEDGSPIVIGPEI